ncbi:phage tail protein [Pseudoalteromonas sp. SD03]|uniref:Phage tail protein n=1 Tax=Pseudoalteromonas sp. SD03 TaxID=3231719 RepID=A0AB39AKZ4_9GAMM
MSKVVDTVVNVVDSIFEVTGLGALWDSLSPDVPEKDLATLGQGLQKGIDQPRRITFGRDRVGGVIAHQAEVEKGGKKWMQLIVLINGAPIDALEEIYIADKKLTDYPRESWDYSLSDGRQTTANAKAVAKMAGWTSKHVGFGQSYVFIEMENNREVFEDGINDMGFLIRGTRVWDPRDTAQNPDDESTWLWSQNAVLCALHYVRFYGAHEVPFERLPLQWWIAAINVCDEDAEFTDVEGVVTTEPRYTTNGSFTFSSKPLEVLGQLEACFAGKIFRQMGQWYVRVGAWYGEPTYTINADDVHGNIKIKWHADLRERANVVRATFTDPEQNYDRTDAPPVVSAGYQAIDNQILEKSISLPFVRSSTTAQRLATIHLEQTRLGEIELPLKHKGLAAAVGRTVYLNLPGESINNKVYRVTERRFRLDGGVTLMCVEDGPDLWADNIIPGAQDLTPNSDYLVGKPQPVFDVRVTVDGDANGIIKWNHPTPLAVNEYDVEFINTAANESVFKTSVTYTQVTIPNLQLGEYTARISAKNIFGQRSQLVAVQFSVLTPTLPTVYVTVDYNQITLTANIAAAGIGTAFEWEFLGTAEQPQSGERVLAQIYNRIGLKSETEYKFRVRSVNHLGASDWVNVTATTTTVDLTKYINNVELTQLSEDAQTLIEDMNQQVDRLRPDTENNLPDVLEQTVSDLNLEKRHRQDIEKGVLDLSANYTNWRQEYERRQLGNERLIDAVVYVDPENGLIVNRAFSYTDDAFNEANLLIDGVNASIALQANRITQSDTRLAQAESELEVQAGKISQRATFTEMRTEIAGAIEALTPAYSWHFNTSTEGFTGDVTYSALGYVTLNTTAYTPAISFIADENPMLRIRFRKHANTPWLGNIYLGESQLLVNVLEPETESWETRNIDLSTEDGYTGEVTSLKFDLGHVDVDFIEIGKRGVNDLALNDITARATMLENDIDAATGVMAQYATTKWVDEFGYQTESNVNQILDTFNSTYRVSATLQQLTDNDTLEKANAAQQFINGAEAYIKTQITAFNAAEGGIDAKFSNVEQNLDAISGTISDNIVQVRGLELELKNANLNDVIAAANQLIQGNELAQQGVKLAVAQRNLKANATDIEAVAQESLELSALLGQNQSQIQALNTAFVNEQQATVARDERYQATFDNVTARFSDVTTAIATIDQANTVRDQEFESFVADTVSSFDEVAETFASQNQAYTTLEQTLTSKINTDTAEAKTQAIATAQEYTRTAVGYCLDAQGNITNSNDAVQCVADGGSWVNGPLAEFIANMQISDGANSASIKQLRQVFKTVDGQLVARGGWQLDNNGRAVGVVGYNDGKVGNLDLVGDVIRQGFMVGNTFVPTSYLDNTDPANPVHNFKGRLILGDGHTVESLEDIKAQDGKDSGSINLADHSEEWVIGRRGSQGPFIQNGSDNENTIIADTGPLGTVESIWYAQAGDNSGDGGWNMNDIPINHEKTYRFSVWMKQEIGIANSLYLGCDDCLTLAGATNTNPYFWSGDLPQINKWYLVVGVLHSSKKTSGTISGLSGVYDPATGKRVLVGTDFKSIANRNVQTHRAYRYYVTNQSHTAKFARPRLEVMDGGEPSVFSLLGTLTTTDPGTRGAGRYDMGTATGAWSDTTANNIVPNGVPVTGDVVTIFKASDPKVQTTKRYTGSTWQSYALHIHGSALIEDTLDGSVLRAGTRIESPRIDMIGTNFLKVEFVNGFGPDNLWYWYGPKVLVNGLPNLNALTKANATEWKDVYGNSFTRGTFVAGSLETSASTSQLISTPSREIEFTSNGRLIHLAVSYSYSRYSIGPTNGAPNTVYCPSSPVMTPVSGTVYLERWTGSSWVVVQQKNFSGTYDCTNGFYESEPGSSNDPYRATTNSNTSFTATETRSAGYVKYRVRAVVNNFISTTQTGQYLSIAASE